MKALVTGNLGFIGSNLTLFLLRRGYTVVGLDAFTYAANTPYLKHEFYKLWQPPFKQFQGHVEFSKDKIIGEMPDVIFHLAAESHVDNCQDRPVDAESSNVLGTMQVLEAARKISETKKVTVIHVSTDEVFGQLKENDPPFDENTPYAPRSVYAATKAASDHIARAYHISYGLDVRITNCTNNYGPGQHEEKLIPRVVKLIASSKPVTVNGSGRQVRDWLHVKDHCEGIVLAYEKGKPGETYLFGGSKELTNLDMIEHVHKAMRRALNQNFELNLTFVNNRPHDDFRYAMNWQKAWKELGWKPRSLDFDNLLDETVAWCYDNLNQDSSREDCLVRLMKGIP